MKIINILFSALILTASSATAKKRIKFASIEQAANHIQKVCDQYWMKLPVNEMSSSTVLISLHGCNLTIEEKSTFNRARVGDDRGSYQELKTTTTQVNLTETRLTETFTNIKLVGNKNAIRTNTIWSADGGKSSEESPMVYTLPLAYDKDGIVSELKNLRSAFKHVIKPCNKNQSKKGILYK